MDITIYTTPACPFCHQLKDFLKANKIEFKEIDVSKNQKTTQEMVEKSKQMAVPVTEINGEIIVGFDVQKLKEKLKIK